MFNWTETTGGPMLVAAPDLLLKWRGVEQGQPDCDYAAACRSDGYLGVLARHGGQVLVLADEPMPACFVVVNAQLLVARWMSCASKSMAEEVLTAIPIQLPHLASPMEFAQQASAIALLDSAQAGAEALASADQAFLPAGKYHVTTEAYEGIDFHFVIHRFKRT